MSKELKQALIDVLEDLKLRASLNNTNVIDLSASVYIRAVNAIKRNRDPEYKVAKHLYTRKGNWWIASSYNTDTVRVFCQDTLIGVVGNTDMSLDEITSNARLISAAPDLLEALEAVMLLLESVLDIKQTPETGSAGHAARTAIAKAKGVINV